MAKNLAIRALRAVLVVGVSTVLVSLSPQGSARDFSLIRDTEIENTIRAYTAPVFEVAGLDPSGVRTYIVQDRHLNAFVAGGQRMFIHTGLLMNTDHPGQVIGVIAHETGHITGGHLVRLHEATRGSTVQSIIAMILGGAAAVAAGDGGAAGAVIAGSATMQQRSLLANTRAFEQQADQAAVNFLDDAGISSRGMLEVMEKLKGQELLPPERQDPYVRSHPLTEERMRFVAEHVARSPYGDQPISQTLQDMHERMRAKLVGYIEQPARTFALYPESDTSVPARYARAVALKKEHRIADALAVVDHLIAESPKDPFFYELKGDILQDAGRLRESLEPLEKAVEILPWAALIRIALAHSQLELNETALDQAALANLREARRYEPEMPRLWRLLSQAYSRTGDEANLMLALAEEAMLTGNLPAARHRADRASDLFPSGSPGWLRAQDIRSALDSRKR